MNFEGAHIYEKEPRGVNFGDYVVRAKITKL